MPPNEATTLSHILAPFETQEFLQTYWTRKFLHLPSQPGKFDHLFGWDVLSRALEQHRFDTKRLRLVRAGKNIDGNRYLQGSFVHSARLTNELSMGATLVFNGCEEVHPPLQALCVHLQELFHTRVHVNLYAGWRRDNGFDIHWDRQDTLILQVSGSKRWKIWNPTRFYPFKEDVVETVTPPTDEPIWDEILHPGALLSIPRGWWHVAYPLDEPCLHLTVTIRNVNGIDMLHWLAEDMKSSDAARMEIPVVAPQQERKEWLARVFSDLTTAWDDSLIDRFLAHVDSRSLPRPCLDLPGGAAVRRNEQVKRNTPLELTSPRPIRFSGEGNTVSITADGTTWQTDSDTAEKLKAFNDFRPHTLDQMAPEPDVRLHAAIGLMLMSGILRVA